MRKQSAFSPISAVFAQSGTALHQLAAITGADKVGRHDHIVQLVGTIFALSLAMQPAKGFGTPADHSKVARIFTDAKMPRYAEACVGVTAALKAKGFRSIPEWEDALAEGFAMANAMLIELRPKVYTKAELATREAARVAKAAKREQEAKAEELAAVASRKAELDAAREAGIAQGKAQAPTITAQMVADMVRAEVFGAEGAALIMEAITAVYKEVATV